MIAHDEAGGCSSTDHGGVLSLGASKQIFVSKSHVLHRIHCISAEEDKAARRVNYAPRRFYFGLLSESHTLEGHSTVLLPVQEGDIWRVQIVWPNGQVHYFGRFASKKEAAEWISNHRWWAIHKIKPPKDGGE